MNEWLRKLRSVRVVGSNAMTYKLGGKTYFGTITALNACGLGLWQHGTSYSVVRMTRAEQKAKMEKNAR